MSHRSQSKNYRWNFTVNLLDGASYWFGSSFISAATIYPLFISKLTSSLIPIALVSVVISAGWFLPQLFSARITEAQLRVKKIAVGWGFFLERLPIFLLVFSGILARSNPVLALTLFFLCVLWNAIGAGVVAPAWMALIAKLFSAEKRGSFMGLTMFIGNGMGIFGSLLSAWFLRTFAFPNSFVIHFLIAAGFFFLSWIFLGLTRETTSEADIVEQDWKSYRKDLWQIFNADHNFRRYVISNVIITLGAMGCGFFTVSAISRFNISDSTVGFYTFSLLFGQSIGNLVLGKLADKRGHKQSMEIGTLAIMLAFIIAVVMPSPEFYFVVFFLYGIYISSGIVSSMLVVWEFCPISRVPTYAGLSNTAKGITGLAAPLLASLIAARTNYDILFGVCVVVTLAGLVLLNRWVLEPRWIQNHMEKRATQE